MTHGNCTGKCLFKLGRLRIELWTVPANEVIEPHTHSSVVSRFIFLDRRLLIRRGRMITFRPPCPWRRWYRVDAGMQHAGRNWHQLKPARFLNIEWWTGQGPAQSPAEDFIT